MTKKKYLIMLVCSFVLLISASVVTGAEQMDSVESQKLTLMDVELVLKDVLRIEALPELKKQELGFEEGEKLTLEHAGKMLRAALKIEPIQKPDDIKTPDGDSAEDDSLPAVSPEAIDYYDIVLRTSEFYDFSNKEMVVIFGTPLNAVEEQKFIDALNEQYEGKVLFRKAEIEQLIEEGIMVDPGGWYWRFVNNGVGVQISKITIEGNKIYVRHSIAKEALAARIYRTEYEFVNGEWVKGETKLIGVS